MQDSQLLGELEQYRRSLPCMERGDQLSLAGPLVEASCSLHAIYSSIIKLFMASCRKRGLLGGVAEW